MDAAQPLATDAWALTMGRRRALLGVAGPPGAGKSTLAARLVDSLREQHGDESAALLPLDGFHLSQAGLARLGLTDRKGSPATFDVHGYLALPKFIRSASGFSPVVKRICDCNAERRGFRSGGAGCGWWRGASPELDPGGCPYLFRQPLRG